MKVNYFHLHEMTILGQCNFPQIKYWWNPVNSVPFNPSWTFFFFLTFPEVNKLSFQNHFNFRGKWERPCKRDKIIALIYKQCRIQTVFHRCQKQYRTFNATWCQFWLWLSSGIYGNKLYCNQNYIKTFCVETGKGKRKKNMVLCAWYT